MQVTPYLCCLIALCAITHVVSKDIDRPATIRCINCICQAATACSAKDACRGAFCGPFAITKEYWRESNSPTVNRVSSSDPVAFLNCANSYYCSYFTIQQYMQKNKKDCNGDGKIDCDDFVALHKLGPNNCDKELPESYQERYEYCQSIIQD